MTESDGQATRHPAMWRCEVPALTGSVVVLREPRRCDAQSLYEALSAAHPALTHITAPFTNDREGLVQFIARAQQQRAAGERVCFAAVPRGCDVAIGLFEFRSRESGFRTAEWDVALAPEFWGSGVFADGARLAIDFLFCTIGARRLEARAGVGNPRASAALMKLGAVQETVLRGASRGERPREDIALWTIHSDDWRPPVGGLGGASARPE